MLGMDAEPGIYLRTLTDLFRAIEEAGDNMDYGVSMSYLEVSCRPRAGSPAAPTALRGPRESRGRGAAVTRESALSPRSSRLPASLSHPRFTTR